MKKQRVKSVYKQSFTVEDKHISRIKPFCATFVKNFNRKIKNLRNDDGD